MTETGIPIAPADAARKAGRHGEVCRRQAVSDPGGLRGAITDATGFARIPAGVGNFRDALVAAFARASTPTPA